MESFLWYFPLSALLNFFTSIVLGLYLVFTNYRKPVVRYLVYFCFTAAWWAAAYFLWQIADSASVALFWSRVLMFGAIFSSLSYFHLVLVFLNLIKLRLYKNILIIFYIISFLFSISNFTKYFVVGVEPRLYFKFWPIPGVLYTPFLIFFATHVLLASVLLFSKFIKTKHTEEKMQTGLLLLGLCIAFIGGSSNYPLWYNIPILPWGNGLVTVYVILTVYAIMKYRFMDIRVVFAELFTGLMIIIFSVDVVLSKTLTEFVFRLFALIVMIIFGVLLIRSVRKEIKRREQVMDLAKSLEEANISLRKLDQQKTEFLSIASHQLRTPLSILNGYIELLKDGAYGKVKRPMGDVLKNMDESNTRLVNLVDEFLNITRIEQGRIKYDFLEHDLSEVVDSVVDEISNRAKQKGILIVWRKPSRPVKIIFDEEKIRNVILNYVDNALKYSEDGKVVITVKENNTGVLFQIDDEGVGFDRVDEVNLFQKFYRGENVRGTNVNGTGLGLYVCSKFVEAHHGRVWAKSAGLKKGSEFGFWLPFNHRS